jgi:hypothetical protein
MTSNLWPPAKGQPINVTVNGSLDEQITAGQYSASAKYEGFPLPGESGSLSDLAPLPWAQGVFGFVYSFPIPSSAPSGKYTAQLSAVDQNKSTLFCINLAFSLKLEGEQENGMAAWKKLKEAKE